MKCRCKIPQTSRDSVWTTVEPAVPGCTGGLPGHAACVPAARRISNSISAHMRVRISRDIKLYWILLINLLKIYTEYYYQIEELNLAKFSFFYSYYLQYTPTRPKSYFSPIWCSRPAWSPTRLPDGQWSKQACWETLFWTWGTALGRRSGVGSKSGRDRSVDFSLAQILIFNR